MVQRHGSEPQFGATVQSNAQSNGSKQQFKLTVQSNSSIESKCI
jgi:hypothetical protein